MEHSSSLILSIFRCFCSARRRCFFFRVFDRRPSSSPLPSPYCSLSQTFYLCAATKLFLSFYFPFSPSSKWEVTVGVRGRERPFPGGRSLYLGSRIEEALLPVAGGRATKHTVSLLLLFFLGALFSPLSNLHLASPSSPQRGTFFPFRQQQQQVSNKQEKNEMCRYASTYFSLLKLLRPFPTFFVQTFSPLFRFLFLVLLWRCDTFSSPSFHLTSPSSSFPFGAHTRVKGAFSTKVFSLLPSLFSIWIYRPPAGRTADFLIWGP